jgi:hypothetical protein
MGDDLPEPGVYHIFLKDVEGVAATLQGEDGLLHGVSTETPTKVSRRSHPQPLGLVLTSS